MFCPFTYPPFGGSFDVCVKFWKVPYWMTKKSHDNYMKKRGTGDKAIKDTLEFAVALPRSR